MNTDSLLDRVWTENYTCYDFANEAYTFITGEIKDTFNMSEIDEPENLCFVLMDNGYQTHTGIMHEDKLFHLALSGVQKVELDIIKLHFKSIRFYK